MVLLLMLIITWVKPLGEREKTIKQNNNNNNKHNVSGLKHTELKCIYTNADSFINKFSEFKGRISVIIR